MVAKHRIGGWLDDGGAPVNPLALALQGVGFGSADMAAQGFSSLPEAPQASGGARFRPAWIMPPPFAHAPRRRPRRARERDFSLLV